MKYSLGFCCLCHNFNWLDAYLCPACKDALRAVTCKTVSQYCCESCGAPLFHRDSRCQCKAHVPMVVRIGLYTKGMQHALIRFKKTEIKLLSHALAALLAHSLPKYKNLIIVPVPCSKVSRRGRGWDQVISIAKILTRLTSHKLALLLGRRGNSAQKNLPRELRLTTAPTSYYLRVEQLHYHAQAIDSCDALVVIDDVMTTGASLYTCIAKIKEVIHKPIFGLCIAMD